MLKLSQPFTRAVIQALISAQILVLSFAGFASILFGKPSVPVLTLDAGNGVTAQFSDYSLSDYGNVNGQYRGNFCFTLTNTSQTSEPSLPIFLVGLGLRRNNPLDISFHVSSSYAAPGNFVANLAQGDINESIAVGALIVARNFWQEQLIDGPTDGLAVGESLTFCMPLRSSSPFTLADLISRFTVVFSDRVEGCYTLRPISSELPPYSRIAVTSLGDDEFGFYLTNQFGFLVHPDVVTAFGFEIRGRSDFSLIDPSPQPGTQNFLLSTSRHALKFNGRETRGKLDFGFLTGPGITEGMPQFGIPPGGSSAVFRVRGDFAGMTSRDILANAWIRVPSGWETIDDICRGGGPTGGAVRGAVATNPR